MTTTKKGRPTTSPKNTMLRVRLDNGTLEKLEKCSKIKNTSKSDIVRIGINKVFDDIKKWVSNSTDKSELLTRSHRNYLR